MKKKTLLTVVATVAALVAIAYLAVLLLWQFGVLPASETDDALFVRGYGFMPLPVIALAAAVILQICSVRKGKSRSK